MVEVKVKISEQLYEIMRVLETEGIKTISEFLREGLADKVDKEYELYLRLRKQWHRLQHAQELDSENSDEL